MLNNVPLDSESETTHRHGPWKFGNQIPLCFFAAEMFIGAIQSKLPAPWGPKNPGPEARKPELALIDCLALFVRAPTKSMLSDFSGWSLVGQR